MSENDQTFEDFEVAAKLLEKFHDAIRNELSGLLVQERELQCLLDYISEIESELESYKA